MRWRARFCVRSAHAFRGRVDRESRDRCACHSTRRGTRTQRRFALSRRNLDVKFERDGMRFALRVTNETKKHVELSFPSGQTHEFVVVDSVGREVWRWSSTRLFTQAVQNKLLGSGESMRVQRAMAASSAAWEVRRDRDAQQHELPRSAARGVSRPVAA